MFNNLQSDVPQRNAEALLRPVSDAPSQKRGQQKRICIVGLGSISQNPRVVKEADALAAAGYDVVVLFPEHFEWERAMDQRILARAKWRADIVEVLPSIDGRIRRWASALQLRLFRRLCRWTMRFPAAELGCCRYFPALFWRAIRHRSDLYIGHYTGSLPVVAWAARWTGAKFAFDFEDFHRGEAGASESLSGRLIAALEDRYLPEANFITAASWGIADEVAGTTGLPTPTTVLNVFPWSDRASLPAPKPRPSNANLSLYWFSQIVSLDRGLQDAIRAVGSARQPFTLAIRGVAATEVKSELLTLARSYGAEEQITFLPLIHPHELLAAAAEYDIGLCLEVPSPLNRDICITNKMFLYMLAGLAVVASRTRGHEDVLKLCPGAGFLYPSGDAAALAGILDGLAQDCQLLARTKAEALAAARDCWNWERESKLLVSMVEVLG